MVVHRFKRTTNAFNYVFDYVLGPLETVVVDMPDVSPNKRGVNDIGWQADGDVKIYGTVCHKIQNDTTMWEPIEKNAEINKTVSGLKIENAGMESVRIVIRAILN